MEHARIIEKANGRFQLTLSPEAMKALVSMVRLEMDSGWADMEKDDQEEQTEAATALERAIDDVW